MYECFSKSNEVFKLDYEMGIFLEHTQAVFKYFSLLDIIVKVRKVLCLLKSSLILAHMRLISFL